MVWVEFILASVLITVAAMQLAKHGDIIAVRTNLGGMFIGVILLAGATSLPEVLTTVSSISQGIPNLAAGNLLGSNMFNMFLLAILDMVHYKRRLLRKAALKHALSGSLAILLIGIVMFSILANVKAQVGWVGVDSLILLAAYFVAVWLIRGQNKGMVTAQKQETPAGYPSLRRGIIGFLLAAGALTIITPWMVNAAGRIAEITGLGTTFVGTTLVAITTSLPELVTTITAARLGADDMAIGNLFGSNLFNMFALGLTDTFYMDGRFFGVMDPAFLLIAIIGMLMTILALVGNLARLERRILFMEVDALLLLIVYFGGLWFLYSRGVAP